MYIPKVVKFFRNFLWYLYKNILTFGFFFILYLLWISKYKITINYQRGKAFVINESRVITSLTFEWLKTMWICTISKICVQMSCNYILSNFRFIKSELVFHRQTACQMLTRALLYVILISTDNKWIFYQHKTLYHYIIFYFGE